MGMVLDVVDGFQVRRVRKSVRSEVVNVLVHINAAWVEADDYDNLYVAEHKNWYMYEFNCERLVELSKSTISNSSNKRPLTLFWKVIYYVSCSSYFRSKLWKYLVVFEGMSSNFAHCSTDWSRWSCCFSRIYKKKKRMGRRQISFEAPRHSPRIHWVRITNGNVGVTRLRSLSSGVLRELRFACRNDM